METRHHAEEIAEAGGFGVHLGTVVRIQLNATLAAGTQDYWRTRVVGDDGSGRRQITPCELLQVQQRVQRQPLTLLGRRHVIALGSPAFHLAFIGQQYTGHRHGEHNNAGQHASGKVNPENGPAEHGVRVSCLS